MIKLYKNDEPVEFSSWKFPGKEIGVKIPDIDATAQYELNTSLPDSDDIFILLNLADALKQAGVPKENVILFAPYLPYARQDRVCHPGESFALEVFLKVLATAYIGSFITEDVHSKVGEQLIDQHFNAGFCLGQDMCAENLPTFDVLVAPDDGAKHKILEHTQVKNGVPVITLSKTRIDDSVVYDNLPVGTVVGDVCVVDDLCDGGATFIALAKMLRGTQPEMSSLSLYVTHGIFSKGVDALKAYYDAIFVHNMLNEEDFNKVFHV